MAFTSTSTLTAQTLLPAPAAGNRYRVWLVRLIGHRLNSSAATIDGDLATASAGAAYGFLTWAAFRGLAEIAYPGGIALPWEEGLDITHICPIDGQEIRANVYYTLEER